MMTMDGNRRRPSLTTRTSAPTAIRLATFTVLVALSGMILPRGAAGEEATGSYGWVRGEVVSWTTGAPVAGATIRLPGYGVTTTSGRDGSFRFPRRLATDSPYRRITAVVTARGFGMWTVRGLPLRPSNTLLLHAELRRTDWSHTAATPGDGGAGRTEKSERLGLALSGNTCTGWDHPLMPPPTIRVFLHEEGVSRRYDFFFYATHVLPSEWIPSWDADALAAGAIAVKTYAAFRAMSGNAYSGGSNCADVVDSTADQVFDPTYSYPTTDAAVYAAMGSILLRDENLFLAQYWSGSDANSSQDWKKCAYVNTGPFAGRMSQWGTQVCAQEGKVWPDIVQVFYRDTEWVYKRNRLRNPAFDAEAGTQPWVARSSTQLTLGHNQAHTGEWRAVVTPTTSKAAKLHQEAPISGEPNTTYTAKVALRCPDSNSTNCKVTIKLNLTPVAGDVVRLSKSVTVPRDSTWHWYKFRPPAAGISHVQVSLVVASKQKFWADSFQLKSPYGGA